MHQALDGAGVVSGGGDGGGDDGRTHTVSAAVAHSGARLSTRPEQHWSRPPGALPQPPPPHWPQVKAQQAWPLRMPFAHQSWAGEGEEVPGGGEAAGGDGADDGGGWGGGKSGMTHTVSEGVVHGGAVLSTLP